MTASGVTNAEKIFTQSRIGGASSIQQELGVTVDPTDAELVMQHFPIGYLICYRSVAFPRHLLLCY